MKITFLTPTFDVHGGTLVLVEYANYLTEKGHEVIVIGPNKGGGLPFDSTITVKHFPKFPLKWIDFIAFQLVYFSTFLRELSPCDLIIAIYTPLLIPAIRSRKGKVIFLAQDAPNIIWIGSFIRWLLKRTWVREGIVSTVTVSSGMAEIYRHFIGRPVSVIPNGIDHQHFFPQKLKRGNYLLFVGRPNQPKGFMVFKETLKIIQRQFPEINGVVVTPSKEAPQEGIRFITSPSRQELAIIYNQALIYVCASFAESFGLPALEAMACGTPAVITNTLGAAEYAKDGENCLVVPIGEVSALVGAITNLLQDQELYKKLTETGPGTAAGYNWEKSTKKFLEFVENIK